MTAPVKSATPVAARPTHGADAVADRTTQRTSTITTSRRSIRVTRVLVILVYWSRHDSVTPRQAKQAAITGPNTWYRNASYGRQGLSGTATHWVKIPAPRHCGDIESGTFAAAERAAKGYHPSRYDRIVLYEPCSAHGFIGIGNLPGSRVVLVKGGLNMPTAVHEQGHNYGLGHANVRLCHRGSTQTSYRSGSSCSIQEYDDFSSAMSQKWSSRYAGDFTAPQKAALGWLSGHMRTVSSGTVTLNAYERAGSTNAIKVSGKSGRTYWVEYRTARGNDAHLPGPYRGVLIHLSQKSTPRNTRLAQSQLLDPLPPKRGVSGIQSGAPPSYLPVHSSWTTPDGIQFTVVSESSGSAQIKISRGQSMHAPGAVSGVTARALDGEASISFHRAADGGDVVSRYTITASPGGASKTITNYGSATTLSTTFTGLHNGTTYTFSIRATNEIGSHSYSVRGITPQVLPPSVAITSPSVNASVSNLVSVSASATPNPVTKAKITKLVFYADNESFKAVNAASGTATWDTGLVGSLTTGTHTLKVVATDARGRTSTTTETVTVTATSAPAVTVTTPAPDAFTGGTDVAVSGTVTISQPTSQVTVQLIQNSTLQEGVPAVVKSLTVNQAKTWTIQQADLFDDFPTAGTYTFAIVATDSSGRQSSTPYVLHLNEPTVTLTQPSDALNTTTVQGQVTNNSQEPETLTVDLSADGVDLTGAAGSTAMPLTVPAGGSKAFTFTNVDLSELSPGSHNFLAVAHTTGITSDSTAAASTVAVGVHFTPKVTIDSPTTDEQVTGTEQVSGEVTNLSAQNGAVTVSLTLDNGTPQTTTVTLDSGAQGTYFVDVDLDSVPSGSHTIQVTATDPQSVASDPQSVAVAVYQGPSELTVTAPDDGTSVPAGVVHFTGTVTNNSATDDLDVEVDNDGSPVGTGTVTAASLGHTGTFDVSVDLSDDPDGDHDFVVTVTDKNDPGAISSDPLTLTIVHPPTLTLTAPSENATVAGTVDFAGDVTNNSQVDGLNLEIDDTDGTPVATTTLDVDAQASGTIDVPVDLNQLALGPHTFTVKVTNSADAGETDATVDLTNAITVSKPAAGATVSGTAVEFTGSVYNASDTANVNLSIDSDDGVVADDDVPVTVAAGASASFDRTEDVSGMTSAAHTFTITVTDAHDNTTTFTYSLDVDNRATLTVTAPTDGTTQASPVHFAGDVTDNETATDVTIHVVADGTTDLGTEAVPVAAGATTAWTDDVDVSGLSPGTHTFTITAVENDTNQTVSAPVTLTLTITG